MTNVLECTLRKGAEVVDQQLLQLLLLVGTLVELAALAPGIFGELAQETGLDGQRRVGHLLPVNLHLLRLSTGTTISRTR